MASLGHQILNCMRSGQDSVTACVVTLTWGAMWNELAFAGCSYPRVLWCTLEETRVPSHSGLVPRTGKFPGAREAVSDFPKRSLLFMVSALVLSLFK